MEKARTCAGLLHFGDVHRQWGGEGGEPAWQSAPPNEAAGTLHGSPFLIP